MIDDIKNQIRCKDFCEKYNVCKHTYLKYKKAVELNTKRRNLDINLEVYKEYRMTHNQIETANYFKISRYAANSYDMIVNNILLDLD
jgi:ribosomal protein L16/L10AE